MTLSNKSQCREIFNKLSLDVLGSLFSNVDEKNELYADLYNAFDGKYDNQRLSRKKSLQLINDIDFEIN